MGGRKMRFLNSRSLSFNGENNLLAMFHSPSFFLYHIMQEDKKHEGKGKRWVRTMLFPASLNHRETKRHSEKAGQD